MTGAAPLFRSEGAVATASASRYLRQLCKHFAHRLPTTFDPTAGRIEFPRGVATLAATDDRLDIVVAADEAEVTAELAGVVERHLVRFAFREDLAVVWRTG
jgi:hypothetical protein